MAEKSFGVDINLNQNQIKEVRAENLAANPVAGNLGRYFYNTTTNRLMYDDGSNIQTVAALTDVAGLLDFKGGYNATTNTPDLTSGTGILKGDYYVVTVAGTFYGQVLQVGDSLFANSDTPVLLSSWTVVQGNVVAASETVAGVVELATQAEADAGLNDTTAMTPLKTRTLSYLAKKFISASTSVGGAVAVTITHNLNNLKPAITIVRDSTGEEVVLVVGNFTANSFDITKNGTAYNVTVGVVG